MSGWLMVAQTALSRDEELAIWVDVGLSYAGSLPPK
jgi:hypothetical protein